MKKLSVSLLLVLLMVPAFGSAAKKKETEEPKTKLNAETLSGLELRGIGPAINSGRVVDFAVTPGKRHRYFAATASGGLWKTENAGTTWKPVFDGEGSYSIGCVTIDPANPNVIWVGTGENNSQRSVSFGDGVYKSMDGGQSWSNMGLKESEHIGRIVVHPQDSDGSYWPARHDSTARATGTAGPYSQPAAPRSTRAPGE